MLPGDKGRFGVLGDFAALATSVGTNNRGDSIQRPVAPEPAAGADTGEARPRLPQSDTDATPAPAPATATAVESTLTPFKSGNFEFTNLKHTNEVYRDKAVRIIELLRKHDTIRAYVGGRPVRITLHVRTTETPADVTDRGDAGVDINLASYYFEKYDIGYVMGMLAHEIGLHPLASRDTNIPDEESMFAGVPLAVPGLADLKTPRTMSTEGAGQADHIMAAFPSSTRHKIYRDIVLGMANDLAEEAQTGEEGAKPKDVTDLIDTYLMDLATIALTNDKRKDAAWEPRYTARVYNAYKEQFAAQLAPDSPVRSLLPADKSWYNVTSNFLGLGSSVAFNNQGDSIQTATVPSGTETGETRPRLTGSGRDAAPRTGPAGSPRASRPRDKRPRFVVRSGFDARRFTYDGDAVTDLTVRIAMRGGTDEQNAQAQARAFAQLRDGVHEFLNNPGHRLPNGDLLHVTVELVDPSKSPHLTVDLTGRDRVMDQVTWWADADPVQLVHELTHQLGLRDEYRDADSPHRPHIPGSLLGDLNAAPEDSSLAAGGLRGRHLALLGALIGDVAPRPSEEGAREESEQSWDEVREGAEKVRREAVWVDPVSLPSQTDGTENTASTGVPAHMLQDPNTTPDTAATPAPALAPAPASFVMENFEFTNLKSSDERYRTKATRVIELLRDHPTISAYVGDRPVRITLHVRTTEPPADVRDLGDDGVQINLASYYFEKYDLGYVMGMLAHEIGLHPLASRDTNIPDEEEMFAGVPLAVPGLSNLTPPRTMNTVGSGQADHIMAAYPSSTRHGIYRDIVVKMAEMMAEFAQAQVPGAKLQDATDLMDSYLMDLASIAITSDHRLRAAKEPGNTAKVYNEYKMMLAARMTANSPARALLPPDKGMFGVVRDFATLAASAVANNRGDSIQRPTPTATLTPPPADEARPRLPQATDTDTDAGIDSAQQTEGSIEQASSATQKLRGPRDSRPRFVVRSGFDARRFTYDGDAVTDLTVRIAMRGAAEQTPRVFGQLSSGVSEFLNTPGHRLPNGDLLHVTVELVDPSESPHLTVDLVGRDQAMDQVSWWADADPVQLVHELTHQLGLRDEYRDADSPQRPHIAGSLLGDLNAAPEDSSLAAGGLRGRHLALLGALIGNVTARTSEEGAREESEQSWDEVREGAEKVRREAIWVDPVSLPRPSTGETAVTEVPARTPQDPNAVPVAAESVLRPFKLGNFEFTNLNQTDRYVDKAVRIVELLDEHGTIKSYVNGRPVRITLHVRTTETPADVRDLGAAGVEINLASYYFEKYDIGYIMGMLSHEIGLHPLASANSKIPEEENLYAGMPLLVPGLETLSTPRFMNTEGAGQADHIMAAFPHTIRHGIYRDIVVEMAEVLAQHVRVGVAGAKPKDVTDLLDTYLMDLASIAVTNDHRARAMRDPAYTARVYNAYKTQLAEHLADDSPVRALLPGDKGRFGVLGDFAALATSVGTNNRGDSIQRPTAPEPTVGSNTGEARPRLPQSDTEATPAPIPTPAPTPATVVEPTFTPFKSGSFEFTNLKHTNEVYRDKAVRIIELLRKHDTIRAYVGGRPVRITLHVRTTETPADVTDRGDAGVDINLASYYFEKYDIGYVMGMLAHEIGLHPLASRDTNIPDEESMFAGVPLAVPGLADLKTPRTMSTEGAGQADHIMAAFPSSTRHRIYRDIVLGMANDLAEEAETGEEGAKPKDVTDLIDTYLMDLATIALTNDKRKDAAWEPRYTAKVYNAYKEQFAAQLAQDSPVRSLLPADKSWYNVTSNFFGLGSSVAFNNQGDSIQTATATPVPSNTETGETRPRLSPGGTESGSQSGPSDSTPSMEPRASRPRDKRPRFVVRSDFDARRFTYDGDAVTDLTVRIAMRGGPDGQNARTFAQLRDGVHEFLNNPGHRLPNGDLLHVTVELVDPSESPHLTVDLVGRDQAMDQVSWWADADPVQLVHELTHQLGLRDEYRDADSPHRPHIPGSLLGDLNAAPEDSSLAAGGLRGRHLALLGALIGDVTPSSSEPSTQEGSEHTWHQVREDAGKVRREAVWVDPVSLPRPSTGGTAVTEVSARTPQDPNAVPVAAEPVLRPFKLGNFEFTNLNQTDRYV
ncbi:hypothetical protein C6Y14_43750, partial [Streptomyces dioscori]